MSKSDPLEGPLLKIQRADQHIDNLERALQAFRDDNPYTIGRTHDHNTQRLFFFFENCKPLAPEFSILVGEALYQLRSSLDYLVWQLFVKDRIAPPPKSGFPIFTTPQGYKARAGTMIKGIGAGASKRIESFQPFQSAKPHTEHPLWVLQELNNTDKHRLLIVARAIVSFRTTVEVRMKLDAFDVARKQVRFSPNLRTPLIIEDGTQLGSILTDNPEKEVDFKFATEIAIKEVALTKDYAALPLLKQLSRYVGAAVKSFKPDFS
jgi:hypothetical protein